MSSVYSMSGVYHRTNNYRILNDMTARVQKTGAVNREAVAPITAMKATAGNAQRPTGSLPLESVQFVRQYQGEMTELMESANRLRNQANGAQELQVTADSTQTADVSVQRPPAEMANYTLAVQQVATAQVNRSDGVSAAANGLSGTLAIATASGSAQFTVPPAPANKSSSNAEKLNTLAGEINSAQLGVTASVTQKDGKAALAVTASKTGERGAFVASGSLAAATGLDKAAQPAQNAAYSVRKNGGTPVEHSTQSNQVFVDGNQRIQAKLKDTGSVNIQVEGNTEKTANAVQKTVDSYNSAFQLLNSNVDRGRGVTTQMKQLLTASGNHQALGAVGITPRRDGTLAFDKVKFSKAISENPSIAQRVVGGSFGLADNMYTAAQQGLRQSSNSLISEDLKTAKSQQTYHPSSLTASYNSNGAFAVINYQTSGALLNLLV